MLKGDNYSISTKNLLMHEFIGLPVMVENSADKNKAEIQGKIIDETKNLFLIKTRNGLKKIPKKEATFLVSVGDEQVKIDGKKIVVRPEERTKYFWRRRK